MPDVTGTLAVWQDARNINIITGIITAGPLVIYVLFQTKIEKSEECLK